MHLNISLPKGVENVSSFDESLSTFICQKSVLASNFVKKLALCILEKGSSAVRSL